MKIFQILCLIVLVTLSCENKPATNTEAIKTLEPVLEISIVVLGTIQDAGSPQIACKKECCSKLFTNPDPLRKVVSLGVVDPENKKIFLFEATPDITSQLKALKRFSNSEKELPDGVFLTHAHIGHYTGLMYFGKEATNASEIPVYGMPRMKAYLEQNGPWSQLVSNKNIGLQELENNGSIQLTSNLKVTPFTVPHRDEFSETVGYTLQGPNKSALFIPDIDKWEKWEVSIIEAIKKVDYAFLDATFFDGVEINNRDISQIPHPFIIESMMLFKDLPLSEKQKIHFIHFNHTNPALNSESDAYKTIIANGFKVSQTNDVIQL